MKTNLIKKPIITEKSINQANEENVYTFEVDYQASKSQIKAAIQELFEVKVLRVNTLIAPSKRKRTGPKRMPTKTTVKKRALVKLESDQTIELFDIGE